MITCDTLVYKVFDIYQFKITASGMIFSLYFLISTIISEVYGYRLAVRSIWIMVFCQSIYVVLLYLCATTQTDIYPLSIHYYALYYDFWRVMVGTWTSVPVSYFINSFIISKMKVYFEGKWFLIRYLLASMITQAVLLLTSYPISLSGKYSFYQLFNVIATTWLYKVLISIILIPIALWLVVVVKRIEKTDHYDWNESYNPIKSFNIRK